VRVLRLGKGVPMIPRGPRERWGVPDLTAVPAELGMTSGTAKSDFPAMAQDAASRGTGTGRTDAAGLAGSTVWVG